LFQLFKGIAFINGFNLGRYWPRAGPQRTLLVPGSLLNANSPNRLVVVEFERAPAACSNNCCSIGLVDAAVLDALCGH
jgi:Beta-galactosidase jelly roll domain